MKFLLLSIGFNISNQIFSQTDINFFELITVKSIDEIDAELSDLGYNLTKSDSTQKFYAWKNQGEDGFTYQKGLFKISKQSKGNGISSVTLRPQLIFKFITSDKEKYYSIQKSLANSTKYLKGKSTQTKSGIKTNYKYDNIDVVLEKIIAKDEGDIFKTTFIINHPK